ncbi:hypothetical protein [Treponema endosymbiont of Eucomonympha sp.]|uniref:hypothetical protein n=1 Tax=Treponema endosymbiont of Eucomonympha sp. TaxID=1580831 RepID=UPI0007511027|nr:hypothetical protein [Treponema endosymbiont of Eucomonympha sp.]
MQGGNVLALVPKTYIPNYGEFYELRHFAPAPDIPCGEVALSARFPAVPFGTDILITDSRQHELAVAAELCEDLWVPQPPSASHALAGRGESTTDVVFSGHCIIAENGALLAESAPFSGDELLFADIDVERLMQERRRAVTYAQCAARPPPPPQRIPPHTRRLRRRVRRRLDCAP